MCAQEEQVASFAAEFERAKQRLAEMVVEEAETGGNGGEKAFCQFYGSRVEWNVGYETWGGGGEGGGGGGETKTETKK